MIEDCKYQETCLCKTCKLIEECGCIECEFATLSPVEFCEYYEKRDSIEY